MDAITLASAVVPYLSTQCKSAVLSTAADWRIYVEGGERWGFLMPGKTNPKEVSTRYRA